MQGHLSTDVERYAAAAGDFLAGRPVMHNVLLTALAALRAGSPRYPDPPTLAWVTQADRVVGAAHWTAPFSPYLSVMPAAAVDCVVELFAELSPRPEGVIGTPDVASRFASGWTGRTGQHSRLRLDEQVYELTSVRRLSAPSGRARPARPVEADMVLGWTAAFSAEVGVRTGDVQRAGVAERIAAGRMWLWEDGQPVAMAGRTPVVCGVGRIGPVYTLPEHRGRGYGRAVTAAVCARLLATGAERCMLFADATNPVSNAIYRQVGFRPAGNVVELDFEANRATPTG